VSKRTATRAAAAAALTLAGITLSTGAAHADTPVTCEQGIVTDFTGEVPAAILFDCFYGSGDHGGPYTILMTAYAIATYPPGSTSGDNGTTTCQTLTYEGASFDGGDCTLP
jgi:hypothetical protein